MWHFLPKITEQFDVILLIVKQKGKYFEQYATEDGNHADCLGNEGGCVTSIMCSKLI